MEALYGDLEIDEQQREYRASLKAKLPMASERIV